MPADYRETMTRLWVAILLSIALPVVVAGCSNSSSPPLDAEPLDVEPLAVPEPPQVAEPLSPDSAASPCSNGNGNGTGIDIGPNPSGVWQLRSGELILHVGKAGRLARLGHNHLIATQQLEGEAWLDQTGTLHAKLSLAVASLSVDDPELRARYRAQTGTAIDWTEVYRSIPSPKNIEDTRVNMLGSKVLDAARFPLISITASAQAAAAEFSVGTSGSLNTRLRVRLQESDTRLPATLNWRRNSGGDIHWHSNFTLTHTQLGLTPFSALGGALSVAQALNFEVQGVLQHSGSVQAEKIIVGLDGSKPHPLCNQPIH